VVPNWPPEFLSPRDANGRIPPVKVALELSVRPALGVQIVEKLFSTCCFWAFCPCFGPFRRGVPTFRRFWITLSVYGPENNCGDSQANEKFLRVVNSHRLI
jgi:hypothetical protein